MWSNGDIRNFNEDFLENLVHLLNSFSNTGRWPDSLLDATVALLPKTDGSVQLTRRGPLLSFRLCTVFGPESLRGNLYTTLPLFATLRSRKPPGCQF